MEEVEKVIQKFLVDYGQDGIQMFNCRDFAGDRKETLYSKDGIEVLFAPDYKYIEVIGLSDMDFNKLKFKYGE